MNILYICEVNTTILSSMQPVTPIIIPSFEPDSRLIDVVCGLKNIENAPLIIVNDGSGPSYADVFEKLKTDHEVVVLEHERNRGKGRALKTAFCYCLQNYQHILGCVTADSDGQHTPRDIKKFYHNVGVMLSFEKIPFLSMVFSIGFQYWILLNAMFYVCYRRCKRIKIPLAILLAYTCVLYFVPLIIVRYFLALFYLLPMIYVFTLQPLKSSG